MDWCDVHDLVNAAALAVKDALAVHPFEVSIPEDLPPVRADFTLTEQAIVNLLLNAAHHTPSKTAIFLTAGLERAGKRFFFTVSDKARAFQPA